MITFAIMILSLGCGSMCGVLAWVMYLRGFRDAAFSRGIQRKHLLLYLCFVIALLQSGMVALLLNL